MKKLVSLTLALMLALSLFAIPAMAEDTIVLGTLSYLNMTESEFNSDFMSPEAAQFSVAAQAWLYQNGYYLDTTGLLDSDSPVEYKTVFYDSLDAMLMALNAGEIQVIYDLPQTTAQYLCAQNDQLMSLYLLDRDKIEADGGFAMDLFKNGGAGYSFMMANDREDLCAAFNSTIADMKADGTLEQLIQKHIFAAIAGEEIEPIELEFVEGRETIKVAVTGSLPPMDYVAADGTFAGFNTAMLAEIGKRLDKNIEIVQVDSLGRAAALASGTVDAVFWTRSNPFGTSASDSLQNMTQEDFITSLVEGNPDLTEEQKAIMQLLGELVGSDIYFQEDIPENTVITEPYFVDVFVSVSLKQ